MFIFGLISLKIMIDVKKIKEHQDIWEDIFGEKVEEVKRTINEGSFDSFLNAMGEYFCSEKLAKENYGHEIAKEAREQIYEAMKEHRDYEHWIRH